MERRCPRASVLRSRLGRNVHFCPTLRQRTGLDLLEVGYRSPVRLLEPGRKRRGRPTSFWLWTMVGVFTVLLVLGLVLR